MSGNQEKITNLSKNKKIEKRMEQNMKSTGVVRKIDELGRIVLPMELRQNMDIQVKTPLEIFTEGDRIILKKFQPSCIFCSNTEEVVLFNDNKICRTCLEKLKTL